MCELLLPAGSIEKMRYAIKYGADAVYLGLEDFSLRTMKKGEIITAQNLKAAVDEAKTLNKKVYLTLNIFAYDHDLDNLYKNIEFIRQAAPHALIISDFGFYNIVKKELPDINIHISTQANTLNSEAVKFWRDLGAARVILARELSYKQIEVIKKKVPEIEIEVFVHGAQCMSYSGRCLLSDFMTGYERRANQGGCAQSCRWSYKLLEETRPGEYFEIAQNNKGSHILSTKDLCLIKHLDVLKNIGVDSFKIEGRTKSLYYVAAAARAYRMVLDGKMTFEKGYEELLKVGNRGYTTGFFLGKNDETSYSYDISKGLAGADFLGIFLGQKNDVYKILMKNKLKVGDTAQVITPGCNQDVIIEEILNLQNETIQIANTNKIVYIKFKTSNTAWQNESEFALLRTTGIKENKLCD